MAAGSAVTRDLEAVREYDTGGKLWHVPGVGFVSAWGARDGNIIGTHLRAHWTEANGRSISDLARSVHGYLVSEYRPDEHGLQDVGFHIAGIYQDGEPAIFHSYFHSPRETTSYGNYDFQSIGPRGGGTQFLYNGRNDIVHSLITTLIAEGRNGKDPRFRGGSIAELAHLAHFVLRVASEITPGVGPPFIICAKHRDGRETKKRYEQVLLCVL